MKKFMAMFHIKSFSRHVTQVTLLLKRKLEHVGYKWVTSRLFCGSVGQMGQQVRSTLDPGNYIIIAICLNHILNNYDCMQETCLYM